MERTRKKPKNAREVALDVLVKVEKEKSYSNLELNEALKAADLSRADSGLATELVYGTIQRKLTLDWIIQKFLKQEIGKLEVWVANLLRMSLYQLWYLERVPARAAVHEGVEIAKRRGHKGISGMVNGVLRNIVRQKDEISFPATGNLDEKIALEHSHPEWMVARWLEVFGEEDTTRLCEENNRPPKVSVRANLLRVNRDTLLEGLSRDGIEAEPSAVHSAGIIINGGNVAATRWFREGFCTIQDESSMLVGQLLSPPPGAKALDCCAAPGGKNNSSCGINGERGNHRRCGYPFTQDSADQGKRQPFGNGHHSDGFIRCKRA